MAPGADHGSRGQRITVRGDSAFSNDELMVWCEKEGIDYVLGLAKNEGVPFSWTVY